ncbi:MAG: hypothetical protein ABR577_13955 [Pyrinomonadaceae bacterium]
MASVIGVCLIFGMAVLSDAPARNVVAGEGVCAQDNVDEVPDDISRIYIRDAKNALVPLPYEDVSTSMPVSVMMRNGSAGYVELKGEQSEAVVANSDPRFYLFVIERLDPPPHFLVGLTRKKRARRLTVLAEKGRKGFTPLTDATLKLQYRILSRVPVRTRTGFIIYALYVEARPLAPLMAGEYAFVGDNFIGITTFRVASGG